MTQQLNASYRSRTVLRVSIIVFNRWLRCFWSSSSRLTMGKALSLGGLLVSASLFLAACASSSVQRIGTASYSPRQSNADVFVFTDASQVKEPYEVVGIVSYDNPGKYRVLSLGDAIEPLKTKARETGANGIIIDKSQPIRSGTISTGIYAEARAIRLKNRN